jgi:predicted nucleic acid-binding protein
MTLDQLSSGDVVLIDANIILYALQNASLQCQNLLRRFNREDLSGVLTTLQLSEVMHRLMIAEARDHGWVSGANPARALAKQSERIQSLRRYNEAIRDILVLNIRFEPVLPEDFLAALDLQRRYGVMTNDSLFLAVGQRLRIGNLATADRHLTSLSDFKVFYPSDLNQKAT